MLQVDWPARLDLLFMNEPLLGPTWTWIDPETGAAWELMVGGEA